MTLPTMTGPDAVSLEPLRGATVAVLGYGNQGAAHAGNLRDSGIEVVVANRPDTANGRRASADGFPPLDIPAAVEQARLVVIALPDEVQGEVWTASIEPYLRPDAVVGFLHGFALRYGLLTPSPEIGVVLVAPKGPGQTLRDRFTQGQGLPCLFAVHQAANDAEAIGLAWAAGIGATRAAIIRTTVAAETETDLFGEQTVLCGGMTALIRAAFDVLVEAGYPPELAYMECCQEVKQVADLVYERGLQGMTNAISTTAAYGIEHAGARIVDAAVRDRMRELLGEIRSGAFARAFVAAPSVRGSAGDDPIEDAGRAVRGWIPWLSGDPAEAIPPTDR